MNQKISVIIVNWNGKHHLQKCLSSLSSQTFKDFETILVDNGSTDGSVEFVKEKFAYIKIIRLERNKGFCEGNNIGFQQATGEFIALLNNDTRADKHWLQELLSAIYDKPEIGICASCIVNYFNPEILDTAGDGYDISGVGFRIGHGLSVSNYQEKRFVFGGCACAVLYRRSMLEKIGFFDEDFFATGEDIDLNFRARLSGYKCVYAPKALVSHKMNQTVGLDSDFAIYHARRNVEYTYFKNMPALLILATFPFHLLYELLTVFEAIRLGKLKIFIKAKSDFLKNLSHVLKKRRLIQQHRNITLSEVFALFSWNYLWQKIRLTFLSKNLSLITK